MSAEYVLGMRLGMPALCWRVLSNPELCCIRQRGHDGGIHEPKRDLDRDVDAEQMTHSADPTDAEEREEWSGTDWCLAWNSEPPGEDVSHECYKAQPNECANEVIDRLIADVKRLEAERDKFRDLTKRAAVGGLPLAGVDVADLIDKLETEVKRLHEICDPLLDKLAETGLVT